MIDLIKILTQLAITVVVLFVPRILVFRLLGPVFGIILMVIGFVVWLYR